MHILLLGASGFIGSELARAMLREGHRVTGLGRDLACGRRIGPDLEWRQCDLRAMQSASDWAPLLEGVEIIVNASGALQTGLRDDVGKVQEMAILALVEAAARAEVRHMIQISAAGADGQPDSAFMATKARADAALAAAPLGCTILRPGLVIGRNGFGGTELLREVAGMPLLHTRITGTGMIQCVALSDLVACVLRVMEEPEAHCGRFDLVERDGRQLGEIVALHRTWLGFAPARFHFRLPVAALRPISLFADLLGWLGWRSPLRGNSIAALVHGVKGNADETTWLLGREPLSLPETLASLGMAGKADRWHARLGLLYPLALAALILLWLASGVIGLLRTEAAAQLLVDGGMERGLARLCVIGGSLADLAIAIGILIRPWVSSALKASIALTLFYIAGSIAIRPDLWADPLGPMVKVIPALMLALACLAMSGER